MHTLSVGSAYTWWCSNMDYKFCEAGIIAFGYSHVFALQWFLALNIVWPSRILTLVKRRILFACVCIHCPAVACNLYHLMQCNTIHQMWNIVSVCTCILSCWFLVSNAVQSSTVLRFIPYQVYLVWHVSKHFKASPVTCTGTLFLSSACWPTFAFFLGLSSLITSYCVHVFTLHLVFILNADLSSTT